MWLHIVCCVALKAEIVKFMKGPEEESDAETERKQPIGTRRALREITGVARKQTHKKFTGERSRKRELLFL